MSHVQETIRMIMIEVWTDEFVILMVITELPEKL